MSNIKPWASFCMSTYNRPTFLKTQIEVLLKQSFKNFEIVIADNDPNASGKAIAESFNDERIKYECNIDNLGMVKSFNKSIERAEGEFVVMVTDDDPVFENMLSFFFELQNKHKGFSLYCGANRVKKTINEIELINKDDFLFQILDPQLTQGVHWSSCLLKRETLLRIGKLTDYVSGHLVDHIMLVLMGSNDGAVIINREFSSIELHQSNYSKVNISNYYLSCVGFYETMSNHYKNKPNYDRNLQIILKHLHHWFIGCFFSLRKFYTINKIDNGEIINELDFFAVKIMKLPYMKTCRNKYNAKKFVFFFKKNLGLVKTSLH